jgi:hypothetical protein
MARIKRPSGTISVPDLSKIETRTKVVDGDYHAKVAEVTMEQGTEHPYLKWKFRIVGPTCVGGTVYNNTSYSPNSLWNLRQLLEALGQEIPDSAFDIDPKELVDLDLQITVENETYEGKQYPRVTDFSAFVDEAPPARKGRTTVKEEEEEVAPAKAKGKSNGKEQELSADDINDMTQDELEDVIEELDLDVEVASFRTLRKMRAAVIDAAEKAGALTE